MDEEATDEALALKYFKKIPKEKTRLLYKMYKLDFKMFGYDIKPWLKINE